MLKSFKVVFDDENMAKKYILARQTGGVKNEGISFWNVRAN